MGIIILYGIFSYFNKEFFVKTFLYFFYGSIVSFVFLILFFVFTSINFEEFFSQYILFAKSVGSYRFSLFNLSLHDIDEYKFLLFNLIFVVIFLIYSFKKNNKKSIIILSGVFLINVILILHQKLTFNQNYIFFLIPLTMSFIHLNYEKYFPKKKFILLTLILICLLGSIKYHLRFNEGRKFHELNYANIQLHVKPKQWSKVMSKIKILKFKQIQFFCSLHFWFISLYLTFILTHSTFLSLITVL